MKSLLRNKKGQVNDMVAGVVFFFVFAIISLFTYLILSNFMTQFSNAGLNTATMDSVAENFLWGVSILDYIAIIVMVAVIAGVGYSSFKVATHPIFFLVTFILAPFLAFMSYVLSYVFSQIVSNSAFSAVVPIFPRTIIIATNLHWVLLACIVVGSISMFAKRPQGQDINE